MQLRQEEKTRGTSRGLTEKDWGGTRVFETSLIDFRGDPLKLVSTMVAVFVRCGNKKMLIWAWGG